jgi:hypothetical protein
MRNKATRLVLSFVCVASGALGVAACTSGATVGTPSAARPPAGSPHDVLVAAATATGSGTVHAELTATVNGSPSFGSDSGQSQVNTTVSMVGDFDLADRDASMSITIPPIDGSQATAAQLRLIGQTAYVQAPGLASVTGGKPWISLDAKSFQRALGSDTSNPFSGVVSGDPTKILALLAEAGVPVTEVGPSSVDGVPTTEYQATVDLAGAAGASAGSALGSQIAHSLGLGSIPVSVWIDDQGRVRKLTTDFSVLGVHLDVSMNLSRFGEPVTVSPPPADQVADGSALLGGELGALRALSTLVA